MTNLIYKTRVKSLNFNDFEELHFAEDNDSSKNLSEPYEDSQELDLSIDELLDKFNQFRSDLLLFSVPTAEHPVVIQEITIIRILSSEDEYQSRIEELEELINDANSRLSGIRYDLESLTSQLEDVEYDLDI